MLALMGRHRGLPLRVKNDMKFQYKAKKGPQEIIEGFVEADQHDQAVARVAALGLVPIHVLEALNAMEKPAKSGWGMPRSEAGPKSSFKELMMFTRQMSDLMESSVPILRSLQIVIRQTSKPDFHHILSEIHDAVRDGMPLSQAMLKYPKSFPSYYSQMVRAGEMGGQLNVIFRRLADSVEKQQDMRLKIRSSLAYPLLIMGVGCVTVFILVTFIVPKISVMFEDVGQQLPLPTMILLNVSGWLASFWWLLILVMVVGSYAAARWMATSQGRRSCDGLLLKIPAIGAFLKMASSAQFCRTLATLLESGVPLNNALEAASQTVNNEIFREQVHDLSERIVRGESLSSALQRVSFFPEMLMNMVAVGEETGQIEKSLAKAADSYERQTDETMRTVISLLGPLVLVVVVSIVGCVVLALLLPILQMNMLIQ